MARATASGRFLQLWFVFDWDRDVGRVRVSCGGCRWRGRRVHPGQRPCPRCGRSVIRRPA